MAQRLSLDEVRHVAKLARLRLTPEELERYSAQLSTVLDHIAKISELDTSGVEPMAHPGDLTNRLDEDRVEEGLAVERLLALAPAVEQQFLAVPKVFGDEPDA